MILHTDKSDFTIPTSPIQFVVGGPSTFEFNISLDDDNDFEGDHSFLIILPGTPIANGLISQAEVVITDRDGKLCV